MKVRKEDLAGIAKEVLKKARISGEAFAEPSDSTNVSQPGSGSGIGSAFVVALRGELGAGKTTFTQALAKELSITDAVQSPTYVLMKSYPISFGRFTTLIHIDAYRLEHPEEFSALKPELFLNDPANLIVIEWPERVEGHLPAPNILLNFSHDLPGGRPGGISDDERYIEGI